MARWRIVTVAQIVTHPPRNHHLCLRDQKKENGMHLQKNEVPQDVLLVLLQ